jgi:[CysO sulfur-carrier protein]-S-L-cysteine hydrolase
MLVIDQAVYDAIVAHARADHPDEACGFVSGPEGSDRPARHVPMTNAERSPTWHSFDSGEQLTEWKEMWKRDEEPVVIYHSHSMTEAHPSPTDIEIDAQGFPEAHYVVVSTRDMDGLGDFQFRSFRFLDGEAVEEEVRVVPAYED